MSYLQMLLTRNGRKYLLNVSSAGVLFKSACQGHGQKRCICENKSTVCNDVFKKFDPDILSLLQKRRYLKHDKGGCYQPDLMLHELIHNVKSEWWQKFVQHTTQAIELKVDQKCSSYLDQIEEIVRSNKAKLNLENPNLALNIVTKINLNNIDERSIHDDVVFAKVVKLKDLRLEFDSMQSVHSQWAKEYFHRTGRLQINSTRSNSESDENLTVSGIFQKNSLQLDVQEFSCFRNTSCFPQSFQSSLRECGEPGVLLTNVNLMKFSAALLLDAYHKIIIDDEYSRTILRLHRFMAPVKTAVLIEQQKTTRLTQLAAELCDMVRGMNTSCWDANLLDIDADALDEFGVPFVLVVNEETLENGLMFIRDRDSSLKIQAHISKIEEKVFRYLNHK